ncbi:EAL domain-containing protein [Antarcticirhabdus aurantiaca]|uniref:EAL domain-containing protein n=2 Tax=Antarcticirhabdus aurantiaca TaxID=2606717 RepID=A0ACD4NIH8_9HYPH|nr:EAL domain-containing protein [Jeongeuplla avenae]
MSLVRDVDHCPSREALLSGLIRYAATVYSRVLAEGVETASELAKLRSMGAHLAQGFLLGRPARARMFGG